MGGPLIVAHIGHLQLTDFTAFLSCIKYLFNTECVCVCVYDVKAIFLIERKRKHFSFFAPFSIHYLKDLLHFLHLRVGVLRYDR